MSAIKSIRTTTLAVPFKTAQTVATVGRIAAAYFVVVEVETGESRGLGYAVGLTAPQARSIEAMVDDLTPVVMGKDAREIHGRWQDMARQLRFIGHGPALGALSAIDTALWDALARQAGLPLFRMLGGRTNRLPVYVTGGSLTASGPQLADEAAQLLAGGLRHFKLRVGSPDWRRDVERVRILREAVGDKLSLMVDAVQAWDVATAIQAGREFARLGLAWYEEPVAATNAVGLAEVRKATGLPVVSGETFTTAGVMQLLDAGAVDVVMLDLGYCGGPTEFLQAAAAANARHVPVSPHAFAEISAHLQSAVSIASLVEYHPGTLDRVFDGLPEVRDGDMHLSERPGLGLTLRPDAASVFAVDKLSV